MKRLVLEPKGWPCPYNECPCGLFLYSNTLACMTEYCRESYIVKSGEAFWGGVTTKEELAKITVQPLVAVWQEIE